MLRRWMLKLAISAAAVSSLACAGVMVPAQLPWDLKHMIAPIQDSVVTVAAFGVDGEILKIGSGFFIDRNGTLVTNYHVLEGAYKAEVKTADGQKYPIDAVMARNQLVDLMKVHVLIPRELAIPVKLADEDPAVADRVVVIGSPMGLAQSISEGIVSAIREHPANGKVYQLTAPISEGSSGSPALNLKGEVIGVVTFQAARGQNLNFAVSIKTLKTLPRESGQLSLAEWTIQKSRDDPGLAATLCRQGARLSIRGKYEAALDYFQEATKANPEDPDAWHGLGSCYIGLNQPDNAIEAYHHSITANPDNPSAHFMLAMYYKVLKQYHREIPSLQRVISIDAENVQARFELAIAYGQLDQTDAQIDAFKKILEIKPNHVPTLHLMGQTIGRMGRYDEALDLLLKAGDLAPDNAQIHFDVGVTYRSKKSPQQELRAYTRAIRANPWMTAAHYNIGLLFLEQGNFKLALHQYEILKSLDAASAEHLFNKIYPASLDEIAVPEMMVH